MARRLVLALFLLPTLGRASSPEAMAWLDHERLPGAQALGMGGALTALAEDWTASWHNPALLAWQRRTEFNLGFEGSGLSVARSVSTDGGETESDVSATGLSHAGYAHPLPALRGGLCWGLGWVRLADFDQRAAFPDRTWRVSEDFAGQQGAWLLSVAAQWTASLAGGLSLAFHHGELERVEREEDLDAATFWRSYERVELDGVGLRLGLAWREGPLRLGLLLEPAHTLDVDYRFHQQEGDLGVTPPPGVRGSSGYSLRMPALVGLGTGWKTRFWQAGLAWDWQDWSNLSYDDLPSGLDISLSDQLLARAFQPRQRLRVGGEWTIPQTDLRLRGGAWRENSARSGERLTAWDEDSQPYLYWAVDRTSVRTGVSAGLSWLVQEVVALDLALARESWKEHWLEYGQGDYESVISQRVSRWRVQLAVVYRI